MPKTKSKSFPSRVKNIIGEQFGRLAVIAFSHINKYHASCWKCRCECGNMTIATSGSLRSNDKRSCGCLGIKHGHTVKHAPSPEYQCWIDMKRRCENPKYPAYKWYGARGITVCKEWRDSFEAFYKHVGLRPSPEFSLDRIDNNSGYKPGNVRWTTSKVQMNNRRPYSEWSKRKRR